MKKYFKKAIAVLTAAVMTLSLGMTAFASVFPDVTEENYPWAVEAIEAMAEKGIVQGYENGEYLPAKTVSKLESLVLISRILGFNEEINANLVSAAWDTFGDEVAKYELNYGQNEIAYLLMKGVISVDELEEYIGEVNRNDGLKRYEVAIVLTKALDAVKYLSNESVQALTFEDSSDIPANAKKYVAYVCEIGLMLGMDGNRFAPNESVTRAQIALLLLKLQNQTNYTYATGIVSSMDQTTRYITVKNGEDTVSFKAGTGTILRYKGQSISINDVEVGYDSVITYKNDEVYAVDFTDAMIDEVVYGAYVSSSSSAVTGKTVIINELAQYDTDVDTYKKSTFKVSDDAIITFNDNICTLTSLKAGYYVKLTIEKGIVKIIEATAKDSKVTGRVNKVSLEPAYMLSVEDNDGNVKDYLVSSNVTVKKNGSSATARDVLEGDSVSLNLTYGRISAITATSRKVNKTGIIKEVIISSTPRITVASDNTTVSYAVTNNANILIGDVASNFYDLRVGMSIEFTLESDTIINLKTTANNAVTTWEGTVLLVNASYDLLQISFVDPMTGATRNESVYVKTNASIVDYATQRDKKLSAIKPGNKVSVTGSLVSGIFEAGTVVIIG